MSSAAAGKRWEYSGANKIAADGSFADAVKLGDDAVLYQRRRHMRWPFRHSRCGFLAHSNKLREQFSIHPFLGGNGRIGRLIIKLLLRERQRLESPLLYLSAFIESHRHEYYESLQGIREEYRGCALLEHPRMADLADLLVENPYVMVKAASPEFGWLQEKGATGAGGRKIWVAQDILDAMEAPSSYKP